MSNPPQQHVPVPATIPEEFPEILRDLNRAILKAQPEDIIAFCADYFNKKVKEAGISVLTQQTKVIQTTTR
jgi:hypothetical protein